MPFISKWARRILVCSLLILSVILFSGVTLFNHYLEKNLAQTLERETRVAEEVNWDLEPLGLFDLVLGRTREVEFAAARLAFQEGPVLEDLTFRSRCIQFNRNALWFGKRIEIQELAETELTFRITEAELTTLLRDEWPELNPCVDLSPGAVRIEGILKEQLPFAASVLLEQASDNSLRLSPTALRVAGFEVPAEVFTAYQEVLNWQFPVELPWPLEIEEFLVEEGFLRIKWREK